MYDLPVSDINPSVSFSAWKPVPASSSTFHADLYRLRHSEREYELQLTDLCDLWTESLTSSAIIERVSETNCSIDPGQDGSQFGNLLHHLQKALAGEPGTKIKGRRQMTETSVRVEVRSDLPHGMRRFEWHFKLSLRSKEDMRSCVIYPLALCSHNQNMRLEMISSHLKDKDTAIGKLLDKVESAGLDPMTILPAAVSGRQTKKSSMKKLLLQHVTGLQPFNDQVVAQDHPSEGGNPSQHALESAFAGTAADSQGHQPVEFPTFVSTPAALISQHNRRVSEGSDDDYERQATPPKLRHAAKKGPSNDGPPMESSSQRANLNAASDEETTDDDLDLVPGKPTSTLQHPVQEVHHSHSPDGNSKPVHGPSASRSPETRSPAKKVRSTLPKKQQFTPPQRDDVSDIEGDEAEQSHVQASPIADPLKASPRGSSKVKGKIGGKKVLPIALAEKSDSPLSTAEDRPESAVSSDGIKPKRHGSSNAHAEGPIADEEPQRLHLSNLTPPRETSSERADQKRNQLKAQLEAQKQAQTKKKRRF